MNQKGQTAVEYLITTSFLLLITGVIFAYGLFIYTDSITTSTANTAVNTIVNTVDQVYALGPGTALFITVDIPQNISSISIETTPNPPPRSAFVLSIQGSAGTTEIARTSKTIMDIYNGSSGYTASVLKNEGRYRMKVFWNTGSTIKICVVDDIGACVVLAE